MAQPTNTFSTYDAIGIREDLADVIYNIAPMETPFQTMAGRGKAGQTYHEWQTDTLAAAATNQVIEGDEATLDAVVATARIGNYCQISDKTAVITGTEEVVNKAGRKSEMAYQLTKKSKELKRDQEFALTQNQASVAGDDTTARSLGSFESWITTNDNRASDGSDGGFSAGIVAAPTDGTQRALLESSMKSVLQACWTAGGDPTVLMPGPFNKTVISGFTGHSTRTDRGEDKRLVAAIDVYVSDFGTHRVVPNRFSRDRSLLVISPRLWSVDYLRGYRQHPLSKTGDTEKRQLLVEFTLRSSNEAGSGIVADLTTS